MQLHCRNPDACLHWLRKFKNNDLDMKHKELSDQLKTFQNGIFQALLGKDNQTLQQMAERLMLVAEPYVIISIP